MDLSALIFVALAVAWAVYLIPKAIKHHDEMVRSRSVERFSASMRVLARREPVSSRNARLVVAPSRATGRPQVETKPRTAPATVGTAASSAPSVPARPAAPVTRESARRAARRRRNVLAVILLANAVVGTLAGTAVIHWAWVAVPATLLVAWLVACRVSVRAERARRDAARPGPARPADLIEIGDVPDEELTGEMPAVPAQKPAPVEPAVEPAAAPVSEGTAVVEAPAVVTGEIPIVTATAAGGWTMVPTVLPTYVDKPAAPRRTVSTIDLDSTGVWSSARNDSDTALAREAEEARRESAAEAGAERRASGA